MPNDYTYGPGALPHPATGPTEHWTDPIWKGRYGMGMNDRISYDLGGKGPTNHPGQDPAERQAENSGYLFGKQWPNAAPFIQPIVTAVESAWRDPKEIAGLRRGAAAAQHPVLPDAPFTPSVTTTESDFHVPEFAAPALPSTRPLPSVELPPAPVAPTDDPFTAALDDFMGNRSYNTSGSAFPDPLDTPLETTLPDGNELRDIPFGSVDPTPVEPTEMQPNADNIMHPPTNPLAGSGLTPEEERIRRSNEFDIRDELYGGYYGGGGTGGGNGLGDIASAY